MHHRMQWNKREAQALIRLKSNSNPFGVLSANGENAFLTPFLCEEPAGSDHCEDVRQHMNHQIQPFAYELSQLFVRAQVTRVQESMT
jgi:hypothetical protein